MIISIFLIVEKKWKTKIEELKFIRLCQIEESHLASAIERFLTGREWG